MRTDDVIKRLKGEYDPPRLQVLRREKSSTSTSSVSGIRTTTTCSTTSSAAPTSREGSGASNCGEEQRTQVDTTWRSP